MPSNTEQLLKDIMATAMRDAEEATDVLRKAQDQLDDGSIESEDQVAGLAENMRTLVSDAYTFAGTIAGVLRSTNISEYSPEEAALIVALEAMQVVRDETVAGLRMDLLPTEKVTLH